MQLFMMISPKKARKISTSINTKNLLGELENIKSAKIYSSILPHNVVLCLGGLNTGQTVKKHRYPEKMDSKTSKHL